MKCWDHCLAISGKVRIGQRADGQKGLFASAPLQAGEILIHYDGPVIDHPTRYSIQIDDHKHIEGTPESNAFLNHSCDPNAAVDWNGVYLRALRQIPAGEEITCNYLTTDWELHEPFTCRCGAPGCCGELKGFKYLSSDEQAKLMRYLPPFMKKKVGR